MDTPQNSPPHRWGVIRESVQGSGHIRKGLENQDAIHHFVKEGGIDCAVLAVSDGHGSAKCFRSAEGSQLAVRIAVEAAKDFVDSLNQSPVSTTNSVILQLIAFIVRQWRSEVADHFRRHPFTTEELNRLEQEAGSSVRAEMEREATDDVDGKKDRIALVYGATLLLVAVGKKFELYAQIGDGEILVVRENKPIERPVSEPLKLITNETESLCMNEAKTLFRTAYRHVHGVPAALILACTDGYSESFASSDGFEKAGTDFLAAIKSKGVEPIQSQLKSWLNKNSQEGNGDDVTLGIIYRQDICHKSIVLAEALVPLNTTSKDTGEPT